MKSRLLVVLATIAVWLTAFASGAGAFNLPHNWIAVPKHTQQTRVVVHTPVHYRGWLCIHWGEGAWHDWDSGHNGHYGGLQMHPGWGYGTSYYAAKDSPMTQVWAAERGYRASGYSHRWLYGQWGADFPRCTRYF